MNGIIHSFESFGASDGPGIRFVVFMQGCNMRCKYCHNPDTWKREGESYSAQQVLEKAKHYREYWGTNGGITVSGGEPLLQAEFVTELFTLAKSEGISTVLDTSGIAYDGSEVFDKLFSVTDLVLLDIKHIDTQKHKELTGHENAPVLALAKKLDRLCVPVWIRHVLVPGLESEEELFKLSDFISTLSNVKKVQVLPYHTLGVHKWELLGIPYQLEGISPPSKEELEHAKRILQKG